MNRRELLAGVAAVAIARPNLTPRPFPLTIAIDPATLATSLPAPAPLGGISYEEFVSAILRQIADLHRISYEELTSRWPPESTTSA
ncbi:hypothetical protein [Bradyrhizobium sp. USDA 4350]